MKISTSIYITLFVTIIFSIDVSAQITSNQTDNFNDGTVQGWSEGGSSTNMPMNITDGGPAGTGDNYLQNISSGGSGAGSKLIMFNKVQWKGDYTSAGVTVISMNMNNLGDLNLEMRLAIDGSGGKFSSTNAVSLSAGSGWQTVAFPVGPSDLTAVSGGTDVNATLGNVTELRILHNTSPSWKGLSISAVLGVDNITASDTPVSVERTVLKLPKTNQLEQNYPNPFNPTTTIEYAVTKTADVVINIYNLRGQLVNTLVNERHSHGRYKTRWDGKDNFGQYVASGVYIYRIIAGDFQTSKKLILMK